MITQEEIPFTQEEYKAMVKTIEQLRKEKQELITSLKEKSNFYNAKLKRSKYYHEDRGKISKIHGIIMGINLSLSKLGQL